MHECNAEAWLCLVVAPHAAVFPDSFSLSFIQGFVPLDRYYSRGVIKNEVCGIYIYILYIYVCYIYIYMEGG